MSMVAIRPAAPQTLPSAVISGPALRHDPPATFKLAAVLNEGRLVQLLLGGRAAVMFSIRCESAD